MSVIPPTQTSKHGSAEFKAEAIDKVKQTQKESNRVRTNRTLSFASWICVCVIYILTISLWNAVTPVVQSPFHTSFWNSCDKLANIFFLCRNLLSQQGRRGKWMSNANCGLLCFLCHFFRPWQGGLTRGVYKLRGSSDQSMTHNCKFKPQQLKDFDASP